jgi:para-nitrobenzyl esterase
MTRPQVETASGWVRGAVVTAPNRPSVRRFLGMPYAAPPVGDLRWRAPQPVAPWAGVRDALAFGPACPQAEPLDAPLPGFRMQEVNEDCLSLNVWTPALDGARPVMVWIHGGAYISGGSAQPVYDAARLAAEGDVVVVTINYRLGTLGFMVLDGDADANCGLRDQLAALAWARQHASAFGGDPSRVTVFGESAGAGSILHLLGSSRRGDAFDRAIVQSGQPRTLTPDEAAVVATEVARAVGAAAASSDALRMVPVERLVAAQAEAAAATLATIGMMPFNPAVDGDVCDVGVLDAVRAGRADDIPLVIGTTRDELSLFPDPRAAALDDDGLARWSARLLGDAADAARVIDAYREQLGGEASNSSVWDAVRTDALMRIPNLRVADAHADRGAPTFVSRFDWEAPGIGAAHAVDVPFTFGTFDREGWGEAVGYDARAEHLSGCLRRSLAAFAATGDPGTEVAWGPYGGRRRMTMVFGPDGPCLVSDPDGATRACWRAD